ncbi:N-acetylmuramoyl-L-alanine amidase [Rivularia sp. UHCC 0363]|uniref:N-acetylmuramoyl-L-alanine amidase n=1 Tax=Rivularia sp. UHCC 0363 TaxID=3110244 RepID=UPI002B1FF95E|nr:N-acetylmuramoyl-L-alanine amidase [Rivularia sp. UHCC 0363]MEA5595377.1 N-acetylmuramoyl-L-alanine amidase [Rivularia sp. UHCC 0363]
MKPLLGLVLLASIATSDLASAQEQTLRVVYPPTNHKTTSDRIFFIGTAPPTGQVLINGKPINRSQSGHFAPSFPLQIGENLFTIRHLSQEIQIKVTRLNDQQSVPKGLAFAKESLIPQVDIARLPGELICFSAIAPPSATVSVKLGENKQVPLLLQPPQAQLPSNLAALTGTNQPQKATIGEYSGCTTIESAAEAKPAYQLTLNGQTITQEAPGKISILKLANLPVIEVNAEYGVARTGPSTDYSRLTPLPKGTRSAVTGKTGEWLRLEYGAWIKSAETVTLPNAIVPNTIIRSVASSQTKTETLVSFPLQTPVPVSVKQDADKFTLTLHNTTAQTDTIPFNDNPFISMMDWQQIPPSPGVNSGAVQYVFNLKKNQHWGYKLAYEGTTLKLKLRHPPQLARSRRKPLSGIKILLDPGHGGEESGATGPTGLAEKDVNLTVSKLLREELVKRGATVVMTREDDKFVSLDQRQLIISQEEPTLSLSVHYNALPDYGDAEKTKGVGMFWYHPQAHSLAVFLHNYLVEKLDRPSYGVFWNNLALTRPEAAPSLLLELGFMSNPEEFEWVTNPKQQKKLAQTLADGITKWLKSNS